MSLYDDMGGEPAVRAVLRTLYDRLFEHQLWFTARFLGGPSRYEGKSIPDAHASLPLFPAHFDRRHHLLKQALEAHAVPRHVADEWLRVDQSLKGVVLRSGEEARVKGREP